jgi:hypothetical protein
MRILGVISDPDTGQAQDAVWAFASKSLPRIAYRSESRGGPEYWIIASPAGHDAFARYRVPLAELWRSLPLSARLASWPSCSGNLEP